MTTKTMPNRLGPLVRRTADDDDFKAAVRRATSAGRSAVFKPAPPPARLQRIGATVREAGAAITVVGRNAEKQRRAEQRAIRLRTALIGGGVAAAATGAGLYRRSAAQRAGEPEAVVVTEAVVVETP